MKYIFLLIMLSLVGCQTRTLNEIRVVGDVGLPVPSVTIEVGSIYSGFPHPPPTFVSDDNGKIILPEPITLNGGSYIIASKDELIRYFAREDMKFRERGVLVLRLNGQPVAVRDTPTGFNSRIEFPSIRINEK